MNSFFGGSFTSRINMNLREDKHWSYGARSGIRDARGPRAVRGQRAGADRQDQGVADRDQAGARRRHRPRARARRRSSTQVKAQQTLSLSGRWETNSAVLGSLPSSCATACPDDYWSTYAGKVRALTTRRRERRRQDDRRRRARRVDRRRRPRQDRAGRARGRHRRRRRDRRRRPPRRVTVRDAQASPRAFNDLRVCEEIPQRRTASSTGMRRRRRCASSE